MMLDDAEECQLSGPIGELVPFTLGGGEGCGGAEPVR